MKTNRVIVTILLAVFILIFPFMNAAALSRVEVSPAIGRVGETIEVTISMVTDQLGNEEFSLSYDPLILEYVGDENLEVLDGAGKISFTNSSSLTPKRMQIVLEFRIVGQGMSAVILSSDNGDVEIVNGSVIGIAENPTEDGNVTINGKDCLIMTQSYPLVGCAADKVLYGGSQVDVSANSKNEKSVRVKYRDSSVHHYNYDEESGVFSEQMYSDTVFQPESISFCPYSTDKATVNIEGNAIEAYRLSGMTGMYFMYLETAEADGGWYIYDEQEGTFQSVHDPVTDVELKAEEGEDAERKTFLEGFKDFLSGKAGRWTALTLEIVFLILLLIVLVRKVRARKN